MNTLQSFENCRLRGMKNTIRGDYIIKSFAVMFRQLIYCENALKATQGGPWKYVWKSRLFIIFSADREKGKLANLLNVLVIALELN